MTTPSAYLRICTLLTSVTLLAAPAAAQRAKREVKLDPIPQAQGASLEKDFRALERAWAERRLVQPARERWQNQPWAAEASALLHEALQLIETEAAAEANLGALAPRFRKLVEVAGNEPVIAWMAARAFKDERGNWRDAQPTLDRVLRGGADLPAALECLAMRLELAQIVHQGRDCPEENLRLFEANIRAISDGSYDAEAEAVFVRHQIQAMDLVKIEDELSLRRWQDALRGSQWPEWVKLTLEGFAEKELAWVKRSSGWAESVSEEQWRGFAEHLKRARDLLAKANRLRPDRPEAATAMIAVAMGENVDLTETRDWFDRAVSAQFDYTPAYTSMMWALRPRWQGSYELMLAFGKVCADTARFDTMVPSRLMTACLNVNEEVGNPTEVFRHPMVRDSLVAICKGYDEAAPATPPQTRHLRLSNAAMCAWLADDDALAAAILVKVGPRLHSATASYLNEMLLHEPLMRAELAADAGAFGEEVRAAANPPKGSTLESMAQKLATIDDKTLSPAALQYVQDGRDILAFKKNLEAGGWVPLKGRAGLTNFLQSGFGEWSADEDGALIAHGSDTRWSALLWRMPIEEDVEIRADVTLEVPEGELARNGYGIGAFLRWTTEGRARFMAFHEYSGAERAQIYQNKPDKGTPLRRVNFQPVNQLRAWVVNRVLGFEVNGKDAGAISQKKLDLDNDGGHVGLVTFMLPWGAKARFSNIQVRKVSAKLLAAEAKAAGKTPVVAKSGFGGKSGKLDMKWQLAILGGLILAAYGFLKFIKSRQEQ
jgi:hypothetical protein